MYFIKGSDFLSVNKPFTPSHHPILDQTRYERGFMMGQFDDFQHFYTMTRRTRVSKYIIAIIHKKLLFPL